jgi:hypothetical protein
MAKQTLMFTLLPNGITSNSTLRLSVYLSPRLEQGATLAAFPDFLDWPGNIYAHGLAFDIVCGANKATVSAQKPALHADIWKEIFESDTYVAPFQMPDYDKRLVVSYPVRRSMTFLKYAYQTVGTGALGGGERGGLRTLLRNFAFRDGTESTLDDQMSRMRIQMWNEQQHALIAGEQMPWQLELLAQPTAPDGIPTVFSEPPNVRDTATRFALFHHMPPAPNGPPLPQTEADFAKTLDFHKALTAVSSYPWLLRALGLVFDVEVPLDLCADSPAAGAYGTVQITKVTAGFNWAVKPTFVLPSTAYVRDVQSFASAPATDPAFLPQHQYLAGDVVDGVLALTSDSFNLTQVDLDGGLLKALALADNAENMAGRLDDQSLPALRSSGIALVANERGVQLLHSLADNRQFDDALQANAAMPRAFNARDLVRGFRLDIWSSRDHHWGSLHRRNSSYTFGKTQAVAFSVTDEEGFLQPTAAQPAEDPTRPPDPNATAAGAPQPGTDLYIHERVAAWNGWSLSAPRPGIPLNRSPDPALATTPDPTMNAPMTPFKMTTSFSVVPGSLPSLRFGDRYRVRARAVDLAGNSIPLGEATASALTAPAADALLEYMRFEPVGNPLVVLQQPVQAGATLDRMVIRSLNSNEGLDSLATTDTDHRHIAPPRVSQRLAEQHGKFDGSDGRLRADPATYNMLVARDAFEFPTQDGVPLDPSALLTVGYLPDPFACGAALRNLPNAPDNTNGRIDTSGALAYATLPDVQPRPGSVTYVDFGTDWPERSPFLLSIAEGIGAPIWDASNKELMVFVPKGETVEIDLSCYLSESNLLSMGVWAWLREYCEARERAAMTGGAARIMVTVTSDTIALLTRLVLEGGHEMITPVRKLTLVHAVLQPLGRPQFVQLPVVHRPTAPIYASGLRNSFTPITAWRAHGSHDAVLLGGLHIHAASTSKIEILANWVEAIDDITKPAPSKADHADHVETIPFATTDPGPIYADATATRKVATYIPKVDTLWFSAPFDDLDGVMTDPDVAAPVHRFNDAKHRFVAYSPVATARYEEYFPQGLDYTRTGNALVVDVPSSARPAAPDIAYVVPTFGWERQETGNVKSSVRFGNGLRVYLRRPWYSSGDNELMGVVLWNGPAPDYAAREAFKPFFTQWGNDPIWKTGYLSDVPSISDFPGTHTSATQLTLAETQHVFDVAGHTVQFDRSRGLWYCDIEFYNSTSYTPFVRLALARYQPHSIDGVELSNVVLADYAQLAANRSAVISIDPADPRKANVFVGGIAPEAPTQSAIEVTVQRRLAHATSDLAWEVASASDVTVAENMPGVTEADAVLWSGTISFAKKPPRGEFRIVIREFERLPIAVARPILGGPRYGERLVYLAIVDYDFPATG